MKKLQGFRTIIFNIVAVAASWVSGSFGIDLSGDTQAAIGTTIIAVANIALRVLTKTPVGKLTTKKNKK